MKIMWLLCGGVLAANATSAYADIRCQESSEGGTALGTILCQNTSGDAEVFFRKMPAWGPNAGLLVIDICRLKDKEKYPDLVDGTLPYAWRPLSPSENIDLRNPGPECVRRWCTDKISHFRFAINGLVIPLSGWAIGMSFAIQHDSFEVTCKTLPAAFPNLAQGGGQ